MLPSAIAVDSDERKCYEHILFAEKGEERPEHLRRKRTLLLILELSRQLGRKPSVDDVRWALYSGFSSQQIKFELSNNELVVSAQDIDFSISAREKLMCQYEGEALEIGFKSVFLLEILQNISSANVVVALSDPTRAGLFLPYDNENADEDVLMLLMPMMINV